MNKEKVCIRCGMFSYEMGEDQKLYTMKHAVDSDTTTICSKCVAIIYKRLERNEY